MIQFFTLAELGAESEDCFHPEFLNELEFLRRCYGKPMIVTSCARTKLYNDSLANSSPRSLHIWDKPQHAGQFGCMAIDVKCDDSYNRRKLVRSALILNWTVGVAYSFLHLDKRSMIGLDSKLFVY